MADDQQALKPEEKAQDSAVPTDDKKVQESNQSQESAQETEENFGEPAGDSENLNLPEKGISERTKEQFDKLKDQLKEYKSRLFNESRFKVQSEELKPLYDKSTGLVNLDALEDLQKVAYEAKKRALDAEAKLQQTATNLDTKDLYEAHPELKNPKSKEAKELFDESERIWMHSQAYPEKYGGEALTQKQAADLAKKKMGTKPVQEVNEAKEAASFGAQGKPTQAVQSKVSSEEELGRMKLGTRLGDKDSMIAYMRRIRESKSQ